MIGSRLAHYEITALIGKGGMGEVYRAKDTVLDRDVAIKVLPAEFSHDRDRVARFEREATTLAKLQHTNIATVYGFEENEDRRILVMELVEGEELAERLSRGPIPVEEAIYLATRIAEGLEVAHAMGIVHRDLKPANIKITPDGDVKILDFGLARAFTGDVEGSDSSVLANSPTLTAAMTQVGVILGTAAYMSPEQARGKTTDKQADIWSFGVVLYEMLTADQLFAGETVSDSIGAILNRDPDLDNLPEVPPRVRTLLRRCLARDKRQRLRDIGDARLELEDATVTHRTTKKADGRGSRRAPWLAAALLGSLVVVLGWLALTRGPESAHHLTTLGLPRDEAVDLGIHNAWPRLKFSPDGTEVVYLGGEDFELFRRDVDSFDSQVVPGTEGVSMFTFSPDGLWIAYMAQSKLWKVALSGGAPIEICDTATGPGLAWGADEIYFSRANGGGLWSVSAGGGQPRPISTLDDEREETSHRWPHVLPGGRHLLITIKTAHIPSFDDAQIGLLSLDTGDVEVLLSGGMYPQYLETGHIVYGRDSELFAVPFDLESRAVRSTPTRVLEQVDTVDVNGCAQYALSSAGDLAYLSAGEDQAELELVWLHVSGKVSRLDIDDTYAMQLSIRPDGSQLAALVPAANDKIFIYDFQRRIMTRLTNTPGNDVQPIWSPDGRQILYQNDRDGFGDLYVIPTDGSAPARRILASPFEDFPDCWSPDGARVLFTRLDAGGNPEIFIMPVDGSQEPSPLFESSYSTAGGRISPDGKWLTYVSDSAGEWNVFVRPFGSSGNPVRVSVSGGGRPQWSPDSKTIYFTNDRRMMAVPLEAGATLQVGAPREIFEMDEMIFGALPLMSDGERFLANRANPEMRKHFGIRVVFDWTERINEL
ncbi:serine/threonine-protein kinase [bacterium]|nr:serine/threonine-protein kinase [bacterium]